MLPKKPPYGNPEDYVLVRTREGDFWRKKRGWRGPTPVNEELKLNNKLIGVTNPAARDLVGHLRPYLTGMDAGRITARFGGKLLKVLREKGKMDYSYFGGYEVQKEYPLERLLKALYRVELDLREVRIHIPLDKLAVSPQNTLATHFYFDAVLLWGEPGGKLQTSCVTSPLYAFDAIPKSCCQLSLALPKKKAPWMLLLKVSCLEGNELGAHAKHYGMRVVEAGA